MQVGQAVGRRKRMTLKAKKICTRTSKGPRCYGGAVGAIDNRLGQSHAKLKERAAGRRVAVEDADIEVGRREGRRRRRRRKETKDCGAGCGGRISRHGEREVRDGCCNLL